MRSEIETLKTWITESDNIVFFGGAGVSTESGIPDFRSTDGLYHQKFDYPPETILSHTFFYQNPEYFFRFYREKMLPLDYQPNEAHKKLAALEQAVRDALANGPASAADLKDAMGLSRKHAIPVLEHFDDTGVTRRVGDARELAV